MRLTQSVIKPLIFLCSIALASCSSSDSSTPAAVDDPVTKSLSGTAAAGAAIIGQVTVKGSLGLTKSALIEANGNYTVDVTGLTAPYRLRAVGTVGGRTYSLYSYAEAADVGGNVNITPFTDLIVANTAQQIAADYFNSSAPVDLDPAELSAQEDALQAKLQDVFSALGIDAAIDLLNSTFSADSSGLDAALDLVNIEIDPLLNIATITNLLEGTTIVDSYVDDTLDEAGTLTVIDATILTTAVDDTQQIVAAFAAFEAAFATGLPTQAAIDDYIAADFYDEDTPRALWITEIITDPGLIGLTLSSVSVSDLDSTAGTATVIFSFGLNGVVDPEPVTWFVARDATLGWQVRGDQRIVDTYFNFHCNDYDAADSFPGACGVNTRFWDNDFSNNGTGGVAIASGIVSIIDGIDGVTVKDVIYLGTPDFAAPGDVQVWDEASANYTGDYKGFGTALGEIDSSIFAAGDIVQYQLYTEALDITVTSAPQIAAGAVSVATYTDPLLFAPSTTFLFPDATTATITAISDFTLDTDLVIAWTLAAGTRNSEVLVEVSDDLGNRIEVWIYTFGTTAMSTTFASTSLSSTAATDAGLDSSASTYNLDVRIYASDELTGQLHSRDYRATIPGPAATTGGGGSTSVLVCSYESGYDDLADGGLGAPITPNSFADFETVLSDCGTALAFTAADVAGAVYLDTGETTTFNNTAAAGIEADPETGVFDDGAGFIIDFEWYVEAATCAGCTHSYVVVYSDSTLDADLPVGFSFRETSALIGVTGTPGVSGSTYSFKNYTEQSNYSDTNRETGIDGEIWLSSSVLQ